MLSSFSCFIASFQILFALVRPNVNYRKQKTPQSLFNTTLRLILSYLGVTDGYEDNQADLLILNRELSTVIWGPKPQG